MFWEDSPGSAIRRQETRGRKTLAGTPRILKDHLILSNCNIRLSFGDDKFIYIHSLYFIHMAIYLCPISPP